MAPQKDEKSKKANKAGKTGKAGAEEEEVAEEEEGEEEGEQGPRLVPRQERDEELAPRRRALAVHDDLVLVFTNALMPYFVDNWESELATRTVFREETPPPPEVPAEEQAAAGAGPADESPSDLESDAGATASESGRPATGQARGPAAADGQRVSSTRSGIAWRGSPQPPAPGGDEDPPPTALARRRSSKRRRRRSATSASLTEAEGHTEADLVAAAQAPPEEPPPPVEWRLRDAWDELVRVDFVGGNRYEGRVSRKLPEGHGVYYWGDGGMYEGEWEAGRPTGRGQLTWPDLSWFEGELLGGFRHGAGSFLCDDPAPAAYVGEWRAGRRDGRGVLCMGRGPGDLYEGDWRDGAAHGRGLRVFPGGAAYVGAWQRGRPHGQGTMVWPNADVYRGQWENGEMHGYGVYTTGAFFNDQLCFPPENVYRGMWSHGCRSGVGVLETVRGGAYYGWFENNRKHGAGMVVCCDGTVVMGDPLFSDDRPVELVSWGEGGEDGEGGGGGEGGRGRGRGRGHGRARGRSRSRSRLGKQRTTSKRRGAGDAARTPATPTTPGQESNAEGDGPSATDIKSLAPRVVPFNRPDHQPDLSYHLDRWYELCWEEWDAEDPREEEPPRAGAGAAGATGATTDASVSASDATETAVARPSRIPRRTGDARGRHPTEGGERRGSRPRAPSRRRKGVRQRTDSSLGVDGWRAPQPSAASLRPASAAASAAASVANVALRASKVDSRRPSKRALSLARVVVVTDADTQAAAATEAAEAAEAAARAAAEAEEAAAARRRARAEARKAAEGQRLQKAVLRAMPALRRLYAQYAMCACTCPPSAQPPPDPAAAIAAATLTEEGGAEAETEAAGLEQEAAAAAASGAEDALAPTPPEATPPPTPPLSIPAPPAGQPQPLLARLLWWQMMRDCDLPGAGVSLVELDRAIAANPSALAESAHEPFERLRMWQVLHALLEVAWVRYVRPRAEERPSLADAFDRVLREDLLPHAGRLVGRALTTQRDLLPLRAVHALYRSVGEPHSLRQLLARVVGRGTFGAVIGARDDGTNAAGPGPGPGPGPAAQDDGLPPPPPPPSPPPPPPPPYAPAAPLYALRLSDFPHHVVFGRNAVAAGADVLYLPGAASLFDDQASAHVPPRGRPSQAAAAAVARPWAPRAPGDVADALAVQLSALAALGGAGVVDCVLATCPAAKADGFLVNADYELTLLEFAETLLEAGRRCAGLERCRRLLDEREAEARQAGAASVGGGGAGRATGRAASLAPKASKRGTR